MRSQIGRFLVYAGVAVSVVAFIELYGIVLFIAGGLLRGAGDLVRDLAQLLFDMERRLDGIIAAPWRWAAGLVVAVALIIVGVRLEFGKKGPAE